MSSSPKPKVWPMAGVAAAIVVFVVGYTFITIAYRKPNRPYQPYHDTKTRVNTARLLAAGYQRVELPAQAPADGPGLRNTALPAPGGLPSELKATIVEAPLLPADITDVDAPGEASTVQPYTFRFRCALPDDKRQLGALTLYVKGDSVVITPHFERLAGGLQSRTFQPVFSATIPGGTLKPGRYSISLVGERGSRSWMLYAH